MNHSNQSPSTPKPMLSVKSPSSVPLSLERLFELMRFRPNTKASDHELHPVVTPAESFAKPESDMHAFEILCDEIERIEEDDFGDFMRRVVLYVSRFKEGLRHRHSDILHQLTAIPYRIEEFQILNDSRWAQTLARQWLEVEMTKLADKLVRSQNFVRPAVSRL